MYYQRVGLCIFSILCIRQTLMPRGEIQIFVIICKREGYFGMLLTTQHPHWIIDLNPRADNQFTNCMSLYRY